MRKMIARVTVPRLWIASFSYRVANRYSRFRLLTHCSITLRLR